MDDRAYAEYVQGLVDAWPPPGPEQRARIRELLPPVPPGRWSCPNDPPCPHPTLLHDVADADDRAPTCCADECQCPAATEVER